jgi:hypothetical protein
MKKKKSPERAALDAIVGELTAEAHSDDERIWNFQQAFQKHVSLPCDGFVIGEPVGLVSFSYDGDQRRGVTATCRRSDGREYEVAASEVLVPNDTGGSRYLGAYRHWLGLVPYALDEKVTRRTAISGERARSITMPNPVELIVLSVKQTTARCRPLQSNQTITLRAGRIWDVIPGALGSLTVPTAVSLRGHF